jgi:hypothetical protein
VSLGTRKRQVEVPPAVRDRAREAANRLGPMAKSAQRGAADRIHGARTWAAPRIEQAAQSVKDDVAPRVSGILVATAQRVEPAQKSAARLGRRARGKAAKASREVRVRREARLASSRGGGRNWPKRVGGVAFVLATLGAIAAVVIRRRNNGAASDAVMTEEDAASEAEARSDADALDGQVRTS